MHVRVVLIEGDMQGLIVAGGESAGNRLGYIDRLIRRLSSNAKSVRSGGNLQRFSIGALNALKDHQMLLCSSVQRPCKGEILVNPNPQRSFFELMLYRDF